MISVALYPSDKINRVYTIFAHLKNYIILNTPKGNKSRIIRSVYKTFDPTINIIYSTLTDPQRINIAALNNTDNQYGMFSTYDFLNGYKPNEKLIEIKVKLSNSIEVEDFFEYLKIDLCSVENEFIIADKLQEYEKTKNNSNSSN